MSRPLYRRLITPLLIDAALVSLVVVLSMDAAVYLVYGDIRSDPWHIEVLDPLRLMFAYPATALGMQLARYMYFSSVKSVVVGFLCGWLGSGVLLFIAIAADH